MEVKNIMLIRCWVSSTIMTPRRKDEKYLHRGSVESFLHCGSIEDCADLLGIKHNTDSRTREEKFLHRAFVERFLRCRS